MKIAFFLKNAGETVGFLILSTMFIYIIIELYKNIKDYNRII